MNRKIITIGTSEGVTLPKRLMKNYNLKKGDQIDYIEEKDGIKMIRINNKKDKKEERRKRIANLTANFIDRYRKDLESLSDK